MNLPIDTADDCAFALKNYAKNASLTTMTNGGGTSRKLRLSWCINCPSDGIVATIIYHNHKGGWQNFLGVSAVQSSAVMTIWEV